MVLEQMLRRDEDEANEQDEQTPGEPSEEKVEQPSFRQRVEEQARELNDYQVPTVDSYKNVLDLERQIKRRKNRDGKVYYTGPDGQVLNKAFAERLRVYSQHDWGSKTEDKDQSLIAHKHRPGEHHDRRKELTEYWNSDEAARARMRRRLGKLAVAAGAGAWLSSRLNRDKSKGDDEQASEPSLRDKLVSSQPVQKTKEYVTKPEYEDRRSKAGLALAALAIGVGAGFIGYAIGQSTPAEIAPPPKPTITIPPNPNPSGAPPGQTGNGQNPGGKPRGNGQGQGQGGKQRAHHPLVSDVRPGDYPWNVLRRDGVVPANIMPVLHHAGRELAQQTGAEVDWHGSGRHEWVDINGNSRTRFVIKKLGRFVTVNR